MVIRILDIVPGADTSEQGAIVFGKLKDALASGASIVVSFQGINTATSSFVSAGIIPLLSVYTLHDLKARVRIVDSTRQINGIIRTRLEREAMAAA